MANPDIAHLSPVMLFSGKGGVGKTTLAAATAVQLAEGGSRVLIVSTDPAHSLADVFDMPLGPRPRTIYPGIDAMEVDARSMFGGMVDATATEGAGGLSKLMSLAAKAPGIDEFGAIEVLLQAIEDADHDVVILDTAPTGHTLRLLTLPDLLDGWFGTLLQLRSHFSKLNRLFKRLLPSAAAEPDAATLQQGLLDGKARVATLRAMLADPNKAQIFLVSIPEAMSVLETLRTLELLESQGMPVGAILVNQLQPASEGCIHCERRAQIHRRELAALVRGAGHTELRVIESQQTEIRGFDELRRLAALLWSERSRHPTRPVDAIQMPPARA